MGATLGATRMNDLVVLRTDVNSGRRQTRGRGLILTGPDAHTGIYGPVIKRSSVEPGPCPPRARKEGHPRRFTISHGATGSAPGLCDRRFAGCGHLLCKQVLNCCQDGGPPRAFNVRLAALSLS